MSSAVDGWNPTPGGNVWIKLKPASGFKIYNDFDHGDKMLRYCIIIVSLFSLTACGPSRYVKEMEKQDSVLVFGYAFDADGPLAFNWIQLRQMTGNSGTYVRIRTDEKGLFYGENLPVGQYQIHRFGWGGVPVGETGIFGVQSNSLSFKKEGNPTTVQAGSPGVKFMGSFRYTYTNTGLFSQGKRTFEKTTSPSEKEVLEQLLKHTKGTRWEAEAKKRLAALK